MIKSKTIWILVILVFSFLIRIYNISFPSLTSNEARIAYRGYTLAAYGKDELGRSFPLLFNSLEDYQLPVVSYLTAGGEFIFGKSEFGARIPFIILGTVLVFLTYQIAKFFSKSCYFQLTSALVVALSPALIFLSKTPNEEITLTFIIALIFYLLINKKSLLFVMPAMVTAVLVSKQAWFILLPFVSFTLIFYQKFLERRIKLILIGFSVLLTLVVFSFFMFVPQAKRSLLENNFTLISDITVKNGIDKLRGQGMESGWPSFVDRLLFNKTHFIITGVLHWLSYLNPAIYFGQFDGSGRLNYSSLGTWAKVLLIPFILGVYDLIKRRNTRKALLLSYFLILTFPAIFIYPNFNLMLVVLALPFMALFISSGLDFFNQKISTLILFVMAIELIVNILFLTPEYRNTASLRPSWVKEVVYDIYQNSKTIKTAVSDDIASDVASYIEWYTPVNPAIGFQDVPSPYKFRQYQLGNIKIIGSHESLTSCGKNEKMEIFVSNRDLNKATHLNVQVIKTYQDDNTEKRVYWIDSACI